VSPTTETPLAAWLELRRAAVDAALEQFLPAPPTSPPVLDVAMRYSVRAGGKRLRPMLTLAAAEAVLGDAALALRLALPAACAIELIHTYSLIHDDLPAMDDDTLRRGHPTSHVVFGEGLAILAGDGLLTAAFALLARAPDPGGDPSVDARKLRVIGVIAEAAGAAGMVGGQAVDLAASDQVADPGRVVPGLAGAYVPHPALDAASLADLHARKTGALIRASAVAGAVMAGASSRVVDAISAFAVDLGLAFQIVDDVLDVEGAAADLGKTAGKDARAGKVTYPSLFGLSTSKKLAHDALHRALGALDAVGVNGQLPAIARWVVKRTS
jgi:geranylgeranyl diphosphate synthase type II